MLLKKINKMKSILKENNTIENIDFEQILIESDLIITQSDIQIIDSSTVSIEYSIVDTTNNELLKSKAVGKDTDLKLAQEKAYEYMKKMIFFYENDDKAVNYEPISRKQQKRLFAMASYQKIHSVIELMGYTSIKDIKSCDFPKIVDFLKTENLKKYISQIDELPNIVITFGKYKGKNIKEIIKDKKYLEYLYKNSTNPNIKNISAKALQIYKA